jgi:hypothetical protein
MKGKYITLQILIAAKLNGKNSIVKLAAESSVTATHYIF